LYSCVAVDDPLIDCSPRYFSSLTAVFLPTNQFYEMGANVPDSFDKVIQSGMPAVRIPPGSGRPVETASWTLFVSGPTWRILVSNQRLGLRMNAKERERR
jgi:hypothetical protein